MQLEMDNTTEIIETNKELIQEIEFSNKLLTSISLILRDVASAQLILGEDTLKALEVALSE